MYNTCSICFSCVNVVLYSDGRSALQEVIDKNLTNILSYLQTIDSTD